MHRIWEETTQFLRKPKDVRTGRTGFWKGLLDLWLEAVLEDTNPLWVGRDLGATMPQAH